MDRRRHLLCFRCLHLLILPFSMCWYLPPGSSPRTGNLSLSVWLNPLEKWLLLQEGKPCLQLFCIQNLGWNPWSYSWIWTHYPAGHTKTFSIFLFSFCLSPTSSQHCHKLRFLIMIIHVSYTEQWVSLQYFHKLHILIVFIL